MNKGQYDLIITGDQGRELARIKPNGDVELFGDVNEAALRFWTVVCQQSGGVLTKHSGKVVPDGAFGVIGDGSPELVAEFNIDRRCEFSKLVELSEGSIADHDAQRVVEMLSELREIRDTQSKGSEIRNVFNEACDRLDVLESKLREFK